MEPYFYAIVNVLYLKYLQLLKLLYSGFKYRQVFSEIIVGAII